MSAELKEALRYFDEFRRIDPTTTPTWLATIVEVARRVAEADEWLGCEEHSRAWAEGTAMPVSCVYCPRITVHVLKERR